MSAAKNDKQLKDFYINLLLKDQLNKNFNVVMDRACQDIETEIRKLTPEGGRIDSATLAKATITTNSILRRKQGISAYELHTLWSQDTGGNLHLDDEKLRTEPLNKRKSSPDKIISPNTKIGDTITSVLPQDKHKAREIYLKTDSKPESHSPIAHTSA